MPKVSPEEAERRLAALERTKRPGQEDGNITEACEILKDINVSQLSRWLLINGVKVGIKAAFTKEQCIAELKRLCKQLGRLPARDDWAHLSKTRNCWRTHWRTYDAFVDEAGIYRDDPKILLLDIETAPNRAYFWGPVYKQNINPDWIDANGYVLCWTAKWLGKEQVYFHRLKNKNHRTLLFPIRDLLNEAHAVVHYNGKKFDIPTLNKEFLTHGLPPPSPYKHIDCLKTMWDTFLFPSNKLDYISKTLGIGQKVRHEGPQLWMACMDDEADAWKKMEAYNRHDVKLLEDLYLKIRPWIRNHPNLSALAGDAVCPSCGSHDFRRDGTHLAQVLKYERYQCAHCGTWFRGTKSVSYRKAPRFALA